LVANDLAKWPSVNAKRRDLAALLAREQREHQLGEAIGFLKMRIARHDEGIDADALILLDPRRHGLGIADQRRSGAAADETHAGPEIRADLEPVSQAAMQLCHALLPNRIHARKDFLRRGDGLIGEMADQIIRGLPGFRVGLAHDYMQTDTEREFSPTLVGGSLDACDLLGNLRRRLAPGQICVGRIDGDVDAGIRRAAEIERRARRRCACPSGQPAS
jgi:hypothetical protein